MTIHAGLATLLGAEGYLTGSVGKERRNQIVEHIYYVSENDLEYHQWNDIEMCFPKIRCFQIDTSILPKEKSIEVKNCFYWLVCGAILAAHETINPYVACSKDAFIKVSSEIFYDKVHYRNILMSYMASSWEITFLYLYQCIEETFSSVAVKSLWHRLKPKISSTELSLLLNEELSWRARDMEGINCLFEKLRPESTCGLLFSQVVPPDNFAKSFYKLRNKIVHDTKDDDIHYNDEQWNLLIAGSLYLIIEACIND